MSPSRELLVESPGLGLLRKNGRALGAMVRNTAKAHPVWLLAFFTLGVCGIAWAVMKLIFAAGGGTIFALLRDTGQQVGGGGLPGAAGAAGSGGASGGSDFPSVPTVRNSGPGVQIGKDGGSWRDAAPGMGIGPDEFVRVPDGSSVTIDRPDGHVQTDTGGSLIPGRRLTGDVTPASWLIITTKAVQGAAESVLGTQNVTTGAGPAGNA